MLAATQKEIDRVQNYMKSQAPDLTVELVQKVYSENVLNIRHDVWDVHTNVDRWWVISEPMNLYAQAQFPNMDLALSFHIGVCVRIPRGEHQKLSDIPAEPFVACVRGLQEIGEAVRHAEELADFQAIGVRCREALLSFINIAQVAIPWTAKDEAPKKADLKAWADHICSVALAGEAHKERRHLFKTLLVSAWDFANWLTHSKSSHWHDAEAAFSATDNAVGLSISAVIQHLRGVPAQCPICGSKRLSPQRGCDRRSPGTEWERPTCDKCDWAGEPVPIKNVLQGPANASRKAPEGDCVIATIPLRELKRPRTGNPLKQKRRPRKLQ
jgi:hypothetical protein